MTSPADTPEPIASGSARRNGHLVMHKSLLELLRASGAAAPHLTDVVPLTKAAVADSAADAPSRTCVLDRQGRVVAVLAISSKVDPGQVARSVANAEGARQMLGPELGSVILETLAEGDYEGLSYALWPWRRNLSKNRLVAFFQKRVVSARLLTWLREATAVTRHKPTGDEREAAYRRPLEALANDGAMSNELRRDATRALQRLQDASWCPVVVLEHGDFWLGNVLYPNAPLQWAIQARGFVLIDWAGAKLHGYPFFDLLRLGLSSGFSTALLRKEALAHCHLLDCQPADAFSYLAAGLGAMSLELGHFPHERFRAMAHAAHKSLATALANTP